MSDETGPPDDATVARSVEQATPDLNIAGYRILRRLGEGGMGTVYLAQDEALGRNVAIKIISHAFARDPAIRARFLREARLLATIEHPNVVRVYTFGATEERAYLVMEYVEGETLADRIRRGPMALHDAKEILGKVVRALDAAWDAKIVHRDIKPSNILFDRRGELKVADFGLAKGIEAQDGADSSLTQSGYLLGSPHYVAPEQAQGHDADFRADIYSLGVTLFEMLTGRRPFEGNSALAIIARHLHEEIPSITSFRRDVGKEMADLVVWMTAKNPDDRPSSYRDLLAACDALGAAQPTLITHRRRTRSNGALRRVSIGASLFLLISAIALSLIFRWRSEHQEPLAKADDRLVVAVAPFWGPDPESASEGRSMAALAQQQIVTRLGSAARVIGIDETKEAVRDTDSALALGERLNATAVIWGQALALHDEREIQPSLTLIPRKHNETSNQHTATAAFVEARSLGSDLPSTPEAIHLQVHGANQIEARKASAQSLGDLVTFVAAMHALSQNQPQRAIELLSQTRRTPDALYQKAVCLAQMQRDDDAAHELNEALTLDATHAQSLAMLADIDARASRFADAAKHLRAAAATGRPYTTSEATLYNGVLYAKERYRTSQQQRETATMLAIDPDKDHVLDRWELPGLARVFIVDESGMTVKCDLGPPRSGELMTLHFVKDHFQGQVPHALPLVQRIVRMRPGWFPTNNFGRELGMPGLKLPRAKFQYSPIDADPLAPQTLAELKAALDKAIARDPAQPWYRLSLAFTVWELGDHAGANRIVDEMFAQPNRGTPYYEFSWMIRQMEPLGHPDWADRAYAEALKRRKAERQPIAISTSFDRMLDAPFVRRAAFISAVVPDPPRDRLWLTRAREITGVSIDGDEMATAAWAKYLRSHGDRVGAAAEETAHGLAHEFFGGLRMSLAVQDIARSVQMSLVIGAVVLLLLALRRTRHLGALASDERWALIAIAVLLILAASARVVAASRARLIESAPVPIADDLGHPAIVATLDQILSERDSNELRFIVAVAHHLAGDAQRAGELYRSLSSDEAAENLRSLDSEPPNMPTPGMFAAAFHRLCPYELLRTVKAAWGGRPSRDSMYAVAYKASQTLYISMILAAAMLLLVFGSVDAQPSRRTIPLVVFAASVAFVALALFFERSETARAKFPVAGTYSAQWSEPLPQAYPFPPDPTSEKSMQHALASSEAMRVFWMSIAAGVVVAALAGGLLVRDRLRGRREFGAALVDQPSQMKA